jgi:5-methylcytosine-specific restriction endonuclease McrA
MPNYTPPQPSERQARSKSALSTQPSQRIERARAERRAWLAFRKIVLARDGHACRACGSKDRLDVHHIRARSVGGLHQTQNCVSLCRSCHVKAQCYQLFIRGNGDGKLTITKGVA